MNFKKTINNMGIYRNVCILEKSEDFPRILKYGSKYSVLPYGCLHPSAYVFKRQEHMCSFNVKFPIILISDIILLALATSPKF